MLYNYVNFKHFVVNACFHPLSPWIPQFKYSKTILERYYIASFNKTLSFQKLLCIDRKCHWQLIHFIAPTAKTRLSMCCWQDNTYLAVITRGKNLSNRFLLWKRGLLNFQQLKVEHWKTNSCWWQIVTM